MNKIKNLILSLPLALAALVLLSGGAQAQGNLTIYAGNVFFNNPDLDSMVLVEFPFTLNRHEFKFYQPDSTETDKYFARIFAQLDLINTEGYAVDSAKTYFSVAVPDPETADQVGIKLFNKLSLLVKPGVYTARLTVIDAVSKKENEVFFDQVIVKPAVKDKLALGGLCLAYDIKYVGEEAANNQQMVINGFRVLNSPLSVFSIEDTALFLYGELYNLAFDPEDTSYFRLSYRIIDDSGRVFLNLGSRELAKPGSSAVIAESFDIKGLIPDLYNILVVAADLGTGQMDSAQVPFRIFEPMLMAEQSSLDSKIPDPYENLTLEEKIHLVTYLLTPDEKVVLNRLNDAGRENFLNQYWREHDSNISTKVIENRLEMIERYRYVNRFFSVVNIQTDGWKTDRGRIYMVYGPSERTEDVPAPISGNPFIIWNYYSIKEGQVFVFEDREGFGDYRLVHSNVEGEIYDSDWEQRLKQGTTELY
ncbi:MAG: GWxTD domain-containing protein [Candidatus Zixiibacteriota bacterium]